MARGRKGNKFIIGRQLHDVKKIEALYRSGKHATSFAGRNILSNFFKNKSSKALNSMLYSIDTYSRHQQTKPVKVYNPIYTRKLRRHIQGDLIDVSGLARSNDNISYIALIIDAFSRRVWLKPLRRKTAVAMKKVLEQIVKVMKPFETDAYLMYDLGTEVRNDLVMTYLNSVGLKLETSKTNKCSLAERAIGSVKRLIYPFVTESENRRYIHRLKDFENIINNRHHRMIGMSPIEAEKEENRAKVIAFTQRRFNRVKLKKNKNKQEPKFKVGDLCRISNTVTFKRGYDEHFKTEVFKVLKVLKNLPVCMYEISEWDGTPLEGKFYEKELTPFNSDIFKINKILKEEKLTGGKTRYWVSWLGYADEYNSWVPKEWLSKRKYDQFKNKNK